MAVSADRVGRVRDLLQDAEDGVDAENGVGAALPDAGAGRDTGWRSAGHVGFGRAARVSFRTAVRTDGLRAAVQRPGRRYGPRA